MTNAQKKAADPFHSVFVSANAGTGKTKVLTDRVLRLLLTGVYPEHILCITYTKAAAAEMQTRINEALSQWVTISDTKLSETIIQLTDNKPDDKTLQLARKLFIRVIDSEVGIRIQTIHSFCQSILGQFPLEAGISPYFSLAEEGKASQLLLEAKKRLFLSHHSEDSELQHTLHYFAETFTESSLDRLLAEIIQHRRKFAALLHHLKTLLTCKETIHSLLKLSIGFNKSQLIEESFHYAGQKTILLDLSNTLRENNATHEADILEQWLENPSPLTAHYEVYKLLFLTKTHTPRLKFAKDYPTHADVIAREQTRLIDYITQSNALSIRDHSIHILTLAEALLTLYQELKASQHMLDYDDLVITTRNLLANKEASPWVLYKLDGGIDHILLDEAQDTNPLQWDIIQALIAEFFSGDGQSNIIRTLFIVGDEKQSIYSFQGADPKEFSNIQYTLASNDIATVDLTLSFRSTEPILMAVDKVMATLDAKFKLSAKESTHEAFRKEVPGKIELWPLTTADKPVITNPFSPPTDYLDNQAQTAPHKLALQMADTIKQWTLEKRILPAQKRPVRAGDILILVRRRTAFMHQLIHALQSHNIAVSGLDRMQLLDNLAIQDLMAFGQFLLLPEDDYNLACLLKSPLYNCSEEQLFSLSHNRGENTLWQQLQTSDETEVREWVDELSHFLSRVDYIHPYELYAELLNTHSGRKRFQARMGEEVQDVIDLFLGQSLLHEQSYTASLQHFLHWLQTQNSEIKRDPEQTDNAIRIMTVHGAKGLQAPIVFLPDTTNTPSLDDMLYWTDQNNAFLASPFSDITHEGLSVLKEDAKALMMAEYYRLLYVAMTRAEDELYIAGWQTGKSIKPECWYHLACEALKPIAKEHDKRWILENEQAIYNIITPDEEAKNILPFPEYLTNPAPQEGTLDKPLSPSKLEEADYTPQAINPPSFQRGTLIHTLLELLPNSPAAEWQMRCEQYLEQSENITTETKNEITTEVLALLNNPDFKPLFTETSYAEVPITGKITLDGKPIVISGQIDRLVITNDVVWVIDYKTHQSPPKNLQDTPSSYITQLRAYAALLKEIYPQHQIKAALLWTTIPKLMPVPLDACAA